MEFIAAILVIVVLCIILGVSTGVMIAAALALVGLIIVFVAAFFTVSLIRLLLSEKAEAKFSRIDKRPNGKFRVAYYMVNGQEYPNIFPEEGVFRSKLYKTGRIYTVRIDRSRRFVFDRFACATTAAGFVSGIIMTALAVWALAAMWEV